MVKSQNCCISIELWPPNTGVIYVLKIIRTHFQLDIRLLSNTNLLNKPMKCHRLEHGRRWSVNTSPSQITSHALAQMLYFTVSSSNLYRQNAYYYFLKQGFKRTSAVYQRYQYFYLTVIRGIQQVVSDKPKASNRVRDVMVSVINSSRSWIRAPVKSNQRVYRIGTFTPSMHH